MPAAVHAQQPALRHPPHAVTREADYGVHCKRAQAAAELALCTRRAHGAAQALLLLAQNADVTGGDAPQDLM